MRRLQTAILALAMAGMAVPGAVYAQSQSGSQTDPSNDKGQSGDKSQTKDNSKTTTKSPTGSPVPDGPTIPPTEEEKQKARDEVAKKADSIPQPGENLNKNIKKGSEDDVDAAGTRDIGGRGMGNWYSTDWEIRNGKGYAMEIERSAKLVTDPVINEYINRIGQNIVKNSDSKVPFTIKVLDTDEVNAMALPGGFFYVNSGLILACDEEAELAGVMSHEIAHVAAHHAAREMTRMNYMQIGQVPLIIFTSGTWTGYGIYQASQLALPLTFLQFSRNFEAQADWLGLQYMYRSGYDPQAFIQFFEKIDALQKHKPGMISKAFSSHPQTPDRIERSEEEIATIMPARPDYVVTTSEFDEVKARLARLENKRKINDSKDGNKPTLRRTAGGNNDPNGSGNGKSSDDDRPTLGRRE